MKRHRLSCDWIYECLFFWIEQPFVDGLQQTDVTSLGVKDATIRDQSLCELWIYQPFGRGLPEAAPATSFRIYKLAGLGVNETAAESLVER